MKLTLNDILLILACIILAWMMTACKTPQPIVQTEVKEVVIEREVRDTIVTIAPDSASIKALLECDSAGNVLIKELQEAQGKNVALQAQLKNTNKGTAIVIDCKQDSLERVIALQNEKISELNNNKQTETIEVKYIPSFVKWLAWVGAVAILLVVLWIVLKVYRRFILKV
jgi:preprotein translocase subunit SecF